MRIAIAQVISAPRPFVFARATEFDRLAMALRDRGAEVALTRPDTAGPEGLRLAIDYPVGDRTWAANLDLAEHVPPEALELAVDAEALTGRLGVLFETLAEEATRVAVTVDLAGRGVKGRMLLGSLKLVRARIEARLDADLEAAARWLEADWQAARG